MDDRALPAYADLPVRDGLPPGSSWGVWGDHDCAAAGTYDAFLTSAPLNMPAGVASPPNAIAVR
jgi:hypothetical protein